jgi:hypothetical protein
VAAAGGGGREGASASSSPPVGLEEEEEADGVGGDVVAGRRQRRAVSPSGCCPTPAPTAIVGKGEKKMKSKSILLLEGTFLVSFFPLFLRGEKASVKLFRVNNTRGTQTCPLCVISYINLQNVVSWYTNFLLG